MRSFCYEQSKNYAPSKHLRQFLSFIALTQMLESENGWL